MGRVLAFLYGVVSYVVFLVVFLYAIGFVGNFVVPKSIDTGVEGAFLPSLLVKEIEKGRVDDLRTHVHEVFDFEDGERRIGKAGPAPVEDRASGVAPLP